MVLVIHLKSAALKTSVLSGGTVHFAMYIHRNKRFELMNMLMFAARGTNHRASSSEIV